MIYTVYQRTVDIRAPRFFVIRGEAKHGHLYWNESIANWENKIVRGSLFETYHAAEVISKDIAKVLKRPMQILRFEITDKTGRGVNQWHV